MNVVSTSGLIGIQKHQDIVTLNLTYKQTMAAYDGLQALGMITETKGGYLDRDTGKSDITKYKVTDKLEHMLRPLKVTPLKI